jgi:hypothetical protein
LDQKVGHLTDDPDARALRKSKGGSLPGRFWCCPDLGPSHAWVAPSGPVPHTQPLA